MAGAVNPYGDGYAAKRTVDAIAHFFGAGPAANEFAPAVVTGESAGEPEPDLEPAA